MMLRSWTTLSSLELSTDHVSLHPPTGEGVRGLRGATPVLFPHLLRMTEALLHQHQLFLLLLSLFPFDYRLKRF